MQYSKKLAFAFVSLIVSLHAWADNPTTFGDWAANMSDDKSFMYAGTFNDSGDAFGEYCYFSTKVCGWYLLSHTPCDAKSKSPVLANTDSGANALTLTCLGQMKNGMYSNEFEWKVLEGSMADSSHIGFAIPLASGQFRVIRFSLNGRTQAQQAMEAVFQQTLAKADAGNKSDNQSSGQGAGASGTPATADQTL